MMCAMARSARSTLGPGRGHTVNQDGAPPPEGEGTVTLGGEPVDKDDKAAAKSKST